MIDVLLNLSKSRFIELLMIGIDLVRNCTRPKIYGAEDPEES